jgi:outer membrane protein assembly factor BamB
MGSHSLPKRLLCLLAAVALAAPFAPAEDWPQWGGPRRDFMVETPALAATWPAGGPKPLWSRALGEGYSAVVAEGNRLYTMYREKARLWQIGKEDQEVVVALDAATGNTIWEHRYDAPALPRMDLEYGPGPHSTPLIAGNRLFTVGAMGHFLALDKNSGRVLWSHNLHTEFGVTWGRGYSCSPLAYGDTVILVTGKPGKSVVAFQQSDGRIAWQKQDFDYGPGSPILIRVAGADATPGKAPGKSRAAAKASPKSAAAPEGQVQLVAFMANEVVGLDPANGELLWRHPHKTDWGLNISTPVWGDGNLLFLSSAYSGGSRVLRLKREGGATRVEQVWFSNRMRIHIGNAIRIGDYVYGSSGDFGPTPYTAVNIHTGQTAWQDRGIGRANAVLAGGKLILLDEDGNLALATASPEKLTIHSKAQVLDKVSWTPPTLAGTRLYIRDRKNLRAFDLS